MPEHAVSKNAGVSWSSLKVTKLSKIEEMFALFFFNSFYTIIKHT